MDISLIITTRNRAESLGRTLRSIAEQSIPSHVTWELVVVDNGSSDGTHDVVTSWMDRLPLRALREEVPGMNRSKNRALVETTGALVVFTDDDVIVSGGWIEAYAAAAQRWQTHSIFGGQIIPKFPAAAPPWLADHGFADVAYGRFILPQAEGPMSHLPFGGNWAIRRRRLGAMRFREDMGPNGSSNFAMGGEMSVLRPLADVGEVAVYVPDASLLHMIRDDQLSLGYLAGRAFRIGRQWVKLHPDFAGPHLFGAPRCYWRQLVEAGIDMCRCRIIRDPSQALDATVEFHKVRGIIHEHRLTKRRTSEERAPGGVSAA